LEANEDYRPQLFVLLQPTSPLRTWMDIDAAVELLHRRRADSVVSVTPVAHPPHWMKRIDDGDLLKDYLPDLRTPACRQDLPPAYALNGAIYLIRREAFLALENWYSETTCAYVMPEERSLDIDSPWHMRIADLALRDRENRVAA
jgi:N-acylneuraminate cytidylyltransferase/CMP-N,N'-diacetyllegionaminic acid synthase